MRTLRRFSSRFVLASVLVYPALTYGQTTPAATVAPQPASVAGAAAHVYKTVGAIELRLHVFSPARTDANRRRPAVVFFFGGGWRAGSVMQFVPQAQHFATRGMVAIVADYRVSGRHQTTPFESMADAKSAIRWVRAHAAELGVDPNRIAAAGGSAGGHIAVSAAVIEKGDEPGENATISSKPDALVLFNPVVDTSRIAPFGDRAPEASPFHHLTRALPPTLILHGRADATVPYADVVRFCEKATALGARCQLVGYDDAPHGFFNPQREEGKWHRETLQEADRFLTRLGYLPPVAESSLIAAGARVLVTTRTARTKGVHTDGMRGAGSGQPNDATAHLRS
jgi:acetyl esterase/lipase